MPPDTYKQVLFTYGASGHNLPLPHTHIVFKLVPTYSTDHGYPVVDLKGVLKILLSDYISIKTYILAFNASRCS